MSRDIVIIEYSLLNTAEFDSRFENIMTSASVNRARQVLNDKATTILKNYPILFGYL